MKVSWPRKMNKEGEVRLHDKGVKSISIICLVKGVGGIRVFDLQGGSQIRLMMM